MNVLFVNGCIRENSRTARLCRAYLQKYHIDDTITECVVMNEALQPFNRVMLMERDHDIASANFTASKYNYARTFQMADCIVMGAPFWDCSFPAILKTYIEHICVAGITLGYADGVPISLCNAKQLVYITSAGGYIPPNSSLENYLQELCTMFNIPELKFYKAEGLDIDGVDVEAVLSAIEAMF